MNFLNLGFILNYLLFFCYILLILHSNTNYRLMNKYFQKEQIVDFLEFFKDSPLGLAIWNDELELIQCNPAFKNIPGFHDSGYLKFHQILPDIYNQIELQILDVVQLKTSSDSSEAFIIENDHKESYWKVHFHSFPHSKLRTGIVTTFENITAYKKRERYLLDRWQEFKIMGETIPYGVWRCDTKGKLKYVSKIFLDLIGMNLDEAIEYGWTQRLPKKEIKPMLRKWKNCISNGDNWEHEHTILDSYGNKHTILSRGRPVKNKFGKVVSWVGINLDITERKFHELEQQYQKERLDLLEQTVHMGVFEWDVQSDREIWSEGMEMIYGIPTGRKDYSHQEWLKLIHPDDRAQIVRKLNDDIHSSQNLTFNDFRIVIPDKKIRWIHSRAKILRDSQGNPQKLVGVNIDITGIKETQNNLLEKNRQLENLNSYLNHFAYTTAHDLKSPVNNLKSLMNLLDQVTDYQGFLEFKELIKNPVERLDRTLEGLTEILQSSLGTDPKISSIRVYTLIRRIIDDHSKQVQEAKVKIKLNVDKELKIKYIKSYLVSILTNLLNNAIKYRSYNREPVIKIDARKEENKLFITFSDNGIGIDLEMHRDIFEPFKRYTRQASGTGIGLFIIKSLLEKNGGTIKVESQPDKGTTFSIALQEY